MPSSRRPLVLALAILTALGAACAGADTSDTADADAASATTTTLSLPVSFTELTLDYVDDTVPIQDPSGVASAPARTMATTIRVPDGDGPYPLVVLAHGMDGHPRKFSHLLDAWASAGYVVAAPAFPLTNDDVSPTSLNDYVQQPADMSVVIDGVLEDSVASTGPLAGKIDAEHIGVAGLSLGGATIYGLTANSCCVDDRVDAAIVFSGIRLAFPDGDNVPSDIPLLATHEKDDPVIPFSAGRGAYDAWAGPKWFLTLEGGTHAGPYEDFDVPADDLIIDMSTLYWDAQLRDDASAADEFTAYDVPTDLGTFEAGT